MLGWSMMQAVKEFTKRRKEQRFIHFPRAERGMVWRDTRAAKCRGVEFILDYKRGGGYKIVWPLGC